MDKSFSNQLGSTLAHIQDLFDTVVHSLIKFSKKRLENIIVNNVGNAGES